MSTRSGTAAFGPAYRIMLERGAHAVGSVDRILASTMLRLCDHTADHLYTLFTPLRVRYDHGTRPELEAIVHSVCASASDPEQQLSDIVRFTSALGDGAEHDPRRMRIGGTEEAIIQRRSDWCSDVARVACVLSQVAGFPCRLVYLFDLHRAYSGHVIVEAHRAGRVLQHAGPVLGRRDRELRRVGTRTVRLHRQRHERLLPLHPVDGSERLARRHPMVAWRGRRRMNGSTRAIRPERPRVVVSVNRSDKQGNTLAVWQPQTDDQAFRCVMAAATPSLVQRARGSAHAAGP